MNQPNFDAIVNEDRFDRGIPTSEDSCPIAIAIAETFPALYPACKIERVLVGDLEIHIHMLDEQNRNVVFKYECDRELGEWVNDYDYQSWDSEGAYYPIMVRLQDNLAFIAWDIKEN